MKKHTKNIGILLGLLATLVLPAASPVGAAPEEGGTPNPIVSCEVLGGTKVDKKTCDKQRSLIEQQKRQKELEEGSDLGRQNQEQGPILKGLFSCNNSSSNIENQCIYKLAVAIVNILAAGVGIAVIGGIIYGSILYASSGGAPDRSKQGITIITNALIGLLAYFLMWSLINWLVPGGLFN
jgi:hypothetical protein